LKIPLPLFVAVIAALAIAAGVYVYHTVFEPATIDYTRYDAVDEPSSRAHQRFIDNATNPARLANNPSLGVVKRNDGFDIRIVGARVRYFVRPNEPLRMHVAFTETDLFPANDQVATRARWNALDRADSAKAAEVTPEQIAKLKAIQVPREMTLSQSERDQLLKDAQRYLDTPDDQKAALEKELIETFTKMSASALKPTMDSYRESAKKIREVLTERQITALRNRRG
jgi:hypothetical protein